MEYTTLSDFQELGSRSKFAYVCMLCTGFVKTWNNHPQVKVTSSDKKSSAVRAISCC